MVTVNVLLSGRLRLDGYGQGRALGEDGTFPLAVADTGTVGEVIGAIDIPDNKVAMTMVNGRRCARERTVRPGDRVLLIPADVAALWGAMGRQNFGMDTIFDF